MIGPSHPLIADLVLIGGGHSNIQVMKKFAMKPIGGLRITLVSDKINAAYSGMLPGYLAGYYSYDQCHFDLAKLCQAYGYRFIHEKVVGLDSVRQKVLLEGRPELSYDFAAINVGVEPKPFEESNDKNLPIKPISNFVRGFESLLVELKQKTDGAKIAVVGGGAAGVEISVVLSEKLQAESLNAEVHLFHRSSQLVSNGHQSAHRRLLDALHRKGVTVHLNKEFNGSSIFDKVLLSSQAQAPSWFQASAMPINDEGFIKVTGHLQVEDRQNLFAAGDCIHFSPKPLKKSGVYAVRQGPILAYNLRQRILKNPSLKSFHPEKNVLSLIVSGRKKAIAHRDGGTPLSLIPSSLLWKMKDKIDGDFMEKFSVTTRSMPEPQVHITEENWEQNTCGGCGSKVDASILSSALSKLGLSSLNEDAAVVSTKTGLVNLHSIDQFRSFISDPHIFGEIAVHHGLSDIYAMGGRPTHAMVGLTLTPAVQKLQRDDIIQVMAGVKKALQINGASLIGGHTNEGAEVSLSLSVQGEIDEEEILLKKNLKVNDHLILTKPLGTGVILAGFMNLQVSGVLLDEGLQSMLTSNGEALKAVKKFKVQNGTDVTGFGLAGHLNEMLKDSQDAEINYSSLPTFTGIDGLFKQGVRASLSGKNHSSVAHKMYNTVTDRSHPLLFDPQTSGGLLFSVASEQSRECIKELHRAGFKGAAVIGRISAGSGQIRVLP